jgi:hypothetical protein
MKTVYQLDQTGAYLGETIAHESPLEPGIYLIPGGCVETAPPETKEGQVAVWDGVWTLVDVPKPEKPKEPTAKELAAQKIATRKAQIGAELAEIDAKSIRPLRAGETDRLAALEKQASALRSELAKL